MFGSSEHDAGDFLTAEQKIHFDVLEIVWYGYYLINGLLRNTCDFHIDVQHDIGQRHFSEVKNFKLSKFIDFNKALKFSLNIEINDTLSFYYSHYLDVMDTTLF